jgi:FG-GAP repeat
MGADSGQFVGAADFNGDGNPDFLLYNAGTLRMGIWYMNNSLFTDSAAGPLFRLAGV